jgi:hypothetical protein
VGTALLVGCAGTGRVQLAALNFQAIDPPGGPPPKVYTFEMRRCYWWTDDAGRVVIAMDLDRGAWLGRLFHLTIDIALTLDQPPAGRARDYPATSRTLRAVARQGPAMVRFTAVNGVVALYRAPGERLRGSFRFDTARHTLELLGTWSRPARYLFMGTFEAVPDAQGIGRRIAAATEGGWTRDLAPSQPTTAPAAPAPPQSSPARFPPATTRPLRSPA